MCTTQAMTLMRDSGFWAFFSFKQPVEISLTHQAAGACEVALTAFTNVYIEPAAPSDSRTVHQEPRTLLSVIAPALPQPLTTRNPLCLSVDRPVLDVSHQWNHSLCVLCLLLSLNVVFSGSIHMVANARASLLFVAEGCSVCGGDDIVCVSPTEVHLCCFHW